jgi:hypothetical protein
MKCADAAVSHAPATVGDLIVNVARGEHGSIHLTQSGFVEASLNSALAVGQLLPYLGIHSKSLSAGGDGCWLQHQTPQNHQGFRAFSTIRLAETRRVHLIKAQCVIHS